jgi:voltage-gated potassium channel
MSETARSRTGTLTARLRALYEGRSDRAHRFRYALLAFDLLTILFVIATSFSTHGPVVETINTALGVVLAAEFAARLLIARQRLKFLASPWVIADLVAVLSFLAPLAGEGLGFLRVLRTLRLLRAYPLLFRLRKDFAFFRRNEEVIVASINLAVFVFVMTGLVYATQHKVNPQIGNYGDALYFTVTALTTTGFGDITLDGTMGRLISVVVMVCGVTLFLRLAQVLFRPRKVREPCTVCGLELHDADAVHCKHCGEVIRIETEGME